ncbi:Crp/Fnr family transcriptional regulator [Flaviaesturariibacter flavus]|uniref:Crp/Fnr family transcriptional regulator n=1 Tax=Flaviaesturariibacter flavus TaxID=2502780 RepID=A0A4V2NVR9_9BACT|nr:Crp/Fnr family transcriptional regulator [Flaviaesturariibacter flavus]TCJ14552.1 Crp/Fnr family transcriptional regulator [Flaviaesturariibacter flavus]
MQATPCNLSDCFLCRTCLPEWKAALAVHKENRAFKKGRTIFREGDPVQGIFFVYSGSVKIHKQWTAGKELILRFARKGDIVGHRGLGDARYPISATALEDTVLCFIPAEFLEATLRVNAGFTYELLQFYVSELQRAEKRMRNLAHMEVKGRIADALLQIAEVYGRGEDGFIPIDITRQDIASYAGTTYETVFKFLTGLAATGHITTAGKRFRVDDRAALQRFIVNDL